MRIFKCVINEDLNSDLEVQAVALVDNPAIEKNFLAFNEKKHLFIDEAKQIVAGPAMIADMPIYRNDPEMGEYYVVFDKPTIYSIVEKFCAKGFMNNVNLMHNPSLAPEDVTIFQSFISDSEIGISPMKGFEDATDGSWFIAMKINNPDVWAKVKSGEFKGFSVEGLFTMVKVQMKQDKLTPEEAAKRIREILNQTILQD